MKNINKKKYYKIISAIIISIIFSIIANFMYQYKFVSYNQEEITNKELLRKYDVNDIVGKDYKTINDKFISTSNDAWFLLNNINERIDSVEIKFINEFVEPINIAVYYAIEDENFTEDQVLMENDFSGEKAQFNIGQKVTALRIDITNQEGQEFTLDNISLFEGKSTYIRFNIESLYRIAILTIFFLFISAHFIYQINDLYEWLFKNRYYIGVIFVLSCIIFNISGSSIAMWDTYVPNTTDIDGIIFGIPRAIRSDEWAVNSPMALSQVYSSSKFQYFGHVLRGDVTDMFIVYGQPVRDISVIFRPFHWGYLILGASRGLAFFWSTRLVVLFLVSFEFIMLITKQKKILSFLGSLLITLAPVVQWWFAINGLVEMLIYGQLAIILLDRYLKTRSYKKKLVCGIIASFIAGGYVLTFYPAWQIPLFYVFLAMAIGIILENKEYLKFNIKDLVIVSVMLLILGLGLGYVLIKSYGTIKLVMNTTYPGARSEVGGGQFLHLFRYPANLFYSITNNRILGNTCEMASFFDFYPLGLILALYLIFKMKIKDYMLKALVIVDVFLTLWITFPWPSFLCKLTLLYNSQPKRAILALSLVNVILLIKSISIIRNQFSKKNSIILSLILSFVIIPLCIKVNVDYMTTGMIIVSFVTLISSLYLFLRWNEKKYRGILLLCLIISFISGMCVNPIQKGISVVTDNELFKSINEINQNDEGNWIVDNLGYPLNNYPIMAGAPTINSTNVYPNLKRWSNVDVNNEFVDSYNRYAHIYININNSGITSFEGNADICNIDLDISNLETIDTKYILTNRNLEELNTDSIFFEILKSVNGFNIYKVHYK